MKRKRTDAAPVDFLAIDELREGDVLFATTVWNPIYPPIKWGQAVTAKLFGKPSGTVDAMHVAIYGGNGFLIESTPAGISYSKIEDLFEMMPKALQFTDYCDFRVWRLASLPVSRQRTGPDTRGQRRATAKEVALTAAECAAYVARANQKNAAVASYSMSNCVFSVIPSDMQNALKRRLGCLFTAVSWCCLPRSITSKIPKLGRFLPNRQEVRNTLSSETPSAWDEGIDGIICSQFSIMMYRASAEALDVDKEFIPPDRVSPADLESAFLTKVPIWKCEGVVRVKKVGG